MSTSPTPRADGIRQVTPPRGAVSARPGGPEVLRAQLEVIRDLERTLDQHRRAALSHIARAYSGGLLRLCEGRLRNRESAEEVVQEVLSRVQGQLGRVEDESHLRNLLFRMAKNRCVEVGQQRKREASAREGLMKLPSADDPGDDERQALREAISELPKLEDRILLTLSMDFGLPLRHIAEILEITEGACKMRSHRARAKLRQILVAED